MARSRAGKQEHVTTRLHRTRVAGVRQLSPHLRRITLQADSLRDFRDDGPDQRCKLMLRRDTQPRLVLPDPEDWFGSWQRMPREVQPLMRTYTVRASRPHVGEVDIDIAVHGDHHPAGPGSRWGNAARAGDEVGLFGAYAEYEPAELPRHEVVAGDLSALPAIAAILDQLPAAADADVVVELADPADRVAIERDPIGVRWVQARPQRPGAALVEAVRRLPSWPRSSYCWFAAEQATAASLRRVAVRERGTDPAQVMFMGYWRAGAAIDPD